MVREIVTYPNEILSRKADEVTEITDELRELARDMAETMYQGNGIGLAAPQVGESIRMIVVDVTGPEERAGLMPIVNPVIEHTEGVCETEEGCLSVLNFRSKIERAAKVRVTGQDLDGNPLAIDAEDILAVCLQHEIDHLDGMLIVDRVSRLKRSLYDKKINKWLKRKKKN